MKQRWLAVILAFVLIVITACSNGNNKVNSPSPTNTPDNTGTTEPAAETKIDPYGPLEETVTINFAQKLPQGDPKLPAGDTLEDNVIYRFYQEELNTKLNIEWSAVDGDPFNQKVMLAIASRDLPDVMQVNEEQLRLLVKADLLEDLTNVFDKYASPKLKQLHYELAEGKSLATATFNEKLYAVPSTAIKGDAITVLWLRKDWLDKLKLPEPKTIDDVETIAQAFIDNDMSGTGKTIGMTGPNTSELANEKGNRTHGFDAIFSSFHSFPRHWLKGDDGNVTYGSIEPETKEALAKLRDWYAKGIIDKEFFLRDNPNESFMSGQNGLFFGPWWMAWGDLTQAVEQNKEAEWKAYAAPTDKDGNHVTHLQPMSRDYLVVRKGFEHPEAIIKGINIKIGIDRQAPEVPQHLVDRYNTEINSTGIDLTDLFRVNTDDIMAVTNRRHAILDALDGKIEPSTLEPEVQEAYELAAKYMEDRTVVKYYPKAIADGLPIVQTGGFQAYVVGGAPSDNKFIEVSSLLYSPTETMKSRWANLSKLEDETFLKIIIGSAPLDDFDKFTAEWRKIGGDQIIKEVAAEIEQ
jgi:putative aldouronate transport system substrate-binding protein